MLSFMKNLRRKIATTKSNFWGRIAQSIKLRGKVDEELMDEIEEILIRADTGVEMTQTIMDRLRDEIRVQKIEDAELVMDILQSIMRDILLEGVPEEGDETDENAFFNNIDAKPWVIVFVGVNGVGKTTGIGKIANRFVKMGKSVFAKPKMDRPGQ